MSTCPDLELYSVYVDQEMTDGHQFEFTKHLNECPDCQKRISKLNIIRSALLSDSRSISMTETQTDESFKRLCFIMNHKAVVRKADSSVFTKTLKFLSPAIAAAAILAFILPLRLMQNTGTQQNLIIPNITENASLINHRGIIVDNSLSAVLSNSLNVQKLSSLDFSNTSISSIDVFKPALSNDSITIQIKLTKLHEILPFSASGFSEASFAGGSGTQF